MSEKFKKIKEYSSCGIKFCFVQKYILSNKNVFSFYNLYNLTFIEIWKKIYEYEFNDKIKIGQLILDREQKDSKYNFSEIKLKDIKNLNEKLYQETIVEFLDFYQSPLKNNKIYKINISIKSRLLLLLKIIKGQPIFYLIGYDEHHLIHEISTNKKIEISFFKKMVHNKELININRKNILEQEKYKIIFFLKEIKEIFTYISKYKKQINTDILKVSEIKNKTNEIKIKIYEMIEKI